MSFRLDGRIVVSLAVVLLVAVSCAGQTQAQDQKTKDRSDVTSKKTDMKGRASGVIVKVEKVTPGATSRSSTDKSDQAAIPRTFRLTINTAAVWRDWAHDQTTQSVSEPARKEATEGANAVAAKGEPRDKNTLVMVDLTTDTNVETRFRALDDETSKGSKNPESTRRDSAKPTRFDAKDLKSGLFVEVDFRHLTGQNRASTVAVIRPVIDTNTSKEKSK